MPLKAWTSSLTSLRRARRAHGRSWSRPTVPNNTQYKAKFKFKYKYQGQGQGVLALRAPWGRGSFIQVTLVLRDLPYHDHRQSQRQRARKSNQTQSCGQRTHTQE
eukprot:scaffold179570_cov33-Tisochrysis_lutea.AAC.1